MPWPGPPTACNAGSVDPTSSVRGLCQNPAMIRALLVAMVVLLVATFPATWLLMLFLGNIGVNLSYWGALPLGILVSALLGGAGAGSYRV